MKPPTRSVVVHYRQGRFRVAFRAEQTAENECNYIGLKKDGMRVLVVQIAGFIARRITCRCFVGRRLAQGERLGRIVFGSRVETYLPKRVGLRVKIGQKTKAGLTVLGKI